MPWQGLDIETQRTGIEKKVKEEVLALSAEDGNFLLDKLDFEF